MTKFRSPIYIGPTGNVETCHPFRLIAEPKKTIRQHYYYLADGAEYQLGYTILYKTK